jgi:hypothetical protein
VTARSRGTIARLFSGRPRPLLITGLAPLVPILIGSAVNIWYNLTQIDPLLTPRHYGRPCARSRAASRSRSAASRRRADASSTCRTG